MDGLCSVGGNESHFFVHSDEVEETRSCALGTKIYIHTYYIHKKLVVVVSWLNTTG